MYSGAHARRLAALPEVTVADGLAHVELTRATYESSRAGTPVRPGR